MQPTVPETLFEKRQTIGAEIAGYTRGGSRVHQVDREPNTKLFNNKQVKQTVEKSRRA